ncbi:MAG: metal-sensing transcriptional repressor [Candidatus Dormibacteria bacterium]|jgi:DNA-binding FrmR family transcriptional regulator
MKAEHKRNALLRLKTVRGHLDGVIAMVDREDYCPDVMKQVAALQASLEKVNRVLLQNHLETCVTEAIAAGSGDAKIAELLEALRYTSALTDLRERFDPVPLPNPVASSGPAPPAHRRGEGGPIEAAGFAGGTAEAGMATPGAPTPHATAARAPASGTTRPARAPRRSPAAPR